MGRKVIGFVALLVAAPVIALGGHTVTADSFRADNQNPTVPPAGVVQVDNQNPTVPPAGVVQVDHQNPTVPPAGVVQIDNQNPTVTDPATPDDHQNPTVLAV